MASITSEQDQSTSPCTSLETKLPLELREIIYGYLLLSGSYFFYTHPTTYTRKVVLEHAFKPKNALEYRIDNRLRENEIRTLQEGI